MAIESVNNLAFFIIVLSSLNYDDRYCDYDINIKYTYLVRLTAVNASQVGEVEPYIKLLYWQHNRLIKY